MSDEIVILCTTTDRPHVKGATKRHCSICAAEVWFAPSSEKIGGDAPTIVCLDCAPGFMQTGEGRLLPPTAEQLAELREGWQE